MKLLKMPVIVGPTATGKTDLAIRLAERIDGEIISCDSVQIYRHFDIGSGKPSTEELGRIPHHFIGELEPNDEVDAALFADWALERIDEIRARGKEPILCGGTFLWAKALLFGLAAAPPKDDALREEHRKIAEAEGRAVLHQRLLEVDPPSAARLNPNDLVRVSRALEVYQLTGIPLSNSQQEHGFKEPRIPHSFFGLQFSWEEVKERIGRRVHQMFDAGWFAEVEQLLDAGYLESRAMAAVGYREIARYIRVGRGEEEIPQSGPPFPQNEAELRESVIRVTRVFARRQRTWLREEQVQYLNAGELPEQALLTGL